MSDKPLVHLLEIFFSFLCIVLYIHQSSTTVEQCNPHFLHSREIICQIFIYIVSGHTRQGLKCRICKMNVHLDCQEKAPKCQTKARLLRRQKSTSEIETRVPEATAEEESKFFTSVLYSFKNYIIKYITSKQFQHCLSFINIYDIFKIYEQKRRLLW